MKIKYLFLSLSLLVVALAPAQQTQISSDLSGNRQLEISNQPVASPAITSQPSTQLGQVGGVYSFTVAATGVNLSYQWNKDGSSISGATSNTLTISNAQSTDFSNHATNTGMYTVRVSNSAGSVTSSAVALYLDSKQDGIPDWWQTQYFGAVYDPSNPTAGGQPPSGYYTGANGTNTVTNLQAYQDGTDPTNPATSLVTLTTSGPVVVNPAAVRYAPGTKVNLSALGSSFQNWTGDAAGSTNPLTVTMDRNKSIQAVTTSFPNSHFQTTLSNGSNISVNMLLSQADGSLLAGGSFNSFLGSPQWNLGRITPAGVLDSGLFTGTQSQFNGTNRT